MLVWRVEAEDGTGPYSPGVSISIGNRETELGVDMWDYSDYVNPKLNPGFEDLAVRSRIAGDLAEEHSWGPDADSHPGPYAEGWSEREYREKVFGFYSVDQASAWFRGFGQRLTDAGYRLSEYDVDSQNVTYGKYQIVFTKPEGQTPVRHPVIKEIV